jgi:hypothetical protein
MGYAGHFDLDAITGDSGSIYLLEVNARRTGGTHVHEFARHVFGDGYLDRVALLSNDAIPCPGIASLDALVGAIGDLEYPVADEARGVVIMGTSALEVGEFGAIVVGRDSADVLALQQVLAARTSGRD